LMLLSPTSLLSQQLPLPPQPLPITTTSHNCHFFCHHCRHHRHCHCPHHHRCHCHWHCV
jgi:hypothetical protein